MMHDIIKRKVADALADEIPLGRRDPNTERAILIAVETLCAFIPFDEWHSQGLYAVGTQIRGVKS
jgi:hypothetical protein